MPIFSNNKHLKPQDKLDRQEHLSRLLRENLKRRKQQTRQRSAVVLSPAMNLPDNAADK